MKIRVGLIGLGDFWQMRHAPALRALADRFEVRAVCDPVRHRAEQAAAEFHAEAVDGYHVLVQREDIDAVLVLSPQWFRRCRSWRHVSRARPSTVRSDWTLTPTRPNRSSVAWKRRESPSWPNSQAAGPGHHSAEGTDRHAARRAPAAFLPRTLGARVVHRVGRGRRRAIADVSTRYRAGGLVPLRRGSRTDVGHRVIHRSGDKTTEDYRVMSVDFSPRGEPGTGRSRPDQ